MAVRITPGSQVQDELSAAVKSVHCELRQKLLKGDQTLENVWKAHLEDDHCLRSYAAAMHELATGPWSNKEDDKDENRIYWCLKTCLDYFDKGVLDKLLLKDLRRKSYGSDTQLQPEWLPSGKEQVEEIVGEFRGRKLALLDVGSCYNPFAQFERFSVTALDIAPAVETVIKCDFLSLNILAHSQEGSQCSTFPEGSAQFGLHTESQDVVVFSLLLSYFPSPLQRLQCCFNAHTVLRPHGLLLVITPDSSHQNKHTDMMASWRTAIEAVGFHRWSYHKSQHLHCMAFRKTRALLDFLSLSAVHGSHLYIPQDFNTVTSQPNSILHQRKATEEDKVNAFVELPLPNCIDD